MTNQRRKKPNQLRKDTPIKKTAASKAGASVSQPWLKSASARMLMIAKGIWKDSVWSKVIATGVTALLGLGLVIVTRTIHRDKPEKRHSPLKIVHNVGLQDPFATINQMHQFWWTGVFDITNVSPSPVLLNDFEILWHVSEEKDLTLRTANRSMIFIDVFDEADALQKYVLYKQKDAAKIHLNEHFPITIPSTSTRHVGFHFMLDIVPGEYGRLRRKEFLNLEKHGTAESKRYSAIPFRTDDEGYTLLAGVLGLDRKPNTCGTREVSVRFEVGGDQWLEFVPVFLQVADWCDLYLPAPRGGGRIRIGTSRERH